MRSEEAFEALEVRLDRRVPSQQFPGRPDGFTGEGLRHPPKLLDALVDREIADDGLFLP